MFLFRPNKNSCHKLDFIFVFIFLVLFLLLRPKHVWFLIKDFQSVFLPTPPSISFAPPIFFLNFQNILWPFKETHGHHTPKNTFGCRLPEVKIYDFRKSKYITGCQLPEVKIYHRKSTSENQNISPEVNFWKSKIITGSRLPEIKKHYESRLPYIKKLYILFYLIF